MATLRYPCQKRILWVDTVFLLQLAMQSKLQGQKYRDLRSYRDIIIDELNGWGKG
jgi:hypothetical protein